MLLEVGQTWRDNDPRSNGRKIYIESLEYDLNVRYAHCRSGSQNGRRVKIRCDRFFLKGRNGYTLVEDEKEKL